LTVYNILFRVVDVKTRSPGIRYTMAAARLIGPQSFPDTHAPKPAFRSGERTLDSARLFGIDPHHPLLRP